MTTTTDLPAAAAEMADLMLDALTVQIYSVEDGDLIPANDGFVLAIQRVRAALGLPPAEIETAPVWSYSATFADAHGERDSYSTEITARTSSDADREGRRQLGFAHRDASKVDASVVLIAGEAR